MREANPGAAIGGAITGGVATAFLARNPLLALAQTAKKVPALAPVANFLLNTKRGAPLRNVAQLSTLGGAAGVAEGSTRGLIEEGEVVEPGLIGGTFGALGGPVGALAATGVKAVRRVLPGSVQQGFRLLSRRILPKGATDKDTLELADKLQTSAQEFSERTGRAPRLAEVLDDQAAKELSIISQSKPRVGEVFREGEEAALRERPGQLSSLVEEGRLPARTQREGRAAQRKLFEDIIEPVKDTPVVFSPKQAGELLGDPDLVSSLPRNLRARVSEAVSKAQDGPVSLTLTDIDDIRQALRSSAGEGRGAKGVFNELASEIRDFATDQIPEYGAALRTFGRRGDQLKGLEEGRRVFSPNASREFIDTATETAPAQRVGVRQGAQQRISEAALESPSSALRTSQRLAEDEGLQRRIAAALGEQRAGRIRDAGQSEVTAARRLREITRNTDVPSVTEETARSITESLQGVFASQAGGAFRASFASKLIQQGLVPETAARKVAEAITDPKRTAEAISRLRAAGVEVKRINDLIRQSAIAAGSVTGRLGEAGQPQER
jgi:hypothetical protein